jgi:anti-sigma factor RsiW
MRCPIESAENAALLLDYCARKLAPETAEVLERHMEKCPACQEFRAQQSLVWAALDEWDASPVSQDFDRRLRRRIDVEGASPWWARLAPLQRAPWIPVVPVAAAVLVLFAASLFRTPTGSGQVENGPQVRVDAAAVDQIERTLEDLEMLKEFNLVAAADAQNTGSI